MHWNPKGILPPVDCPLVLLVDGEKVQAKRTSWVRTKDDEPTFVLTDNSKLTGKFPWTYP